MLLVILMTIPLIGALFVLFTRNKYIKIPSMISLLVLLLASFRLRDVFGGMSLNYELAMSGPLVLSFQADALTSIFIILTAFIWLVVSIYSSKYFEYEEKASMFQLSSLLTLFSLLGIFLAGDLLTMLLFFEFMTIASYFLVVHTWDKEAIRAGYFYLFFSIVGGLLVALGIVMMGSATDVLPEIASGIVIPSNLKVFTWSIAIFLLGFGIKAGMFPLHTWLPYAYSASSTPGSALLSGIITKVGVYGLIRVGQFVGWGVNLGIGMNWLSSTLLILGTCTMVLGVLAALIQSNAKKLLAYHSISQIGYILLGLGVSLYLGSNGGYGLSGSIYHIINHALFKSALFLGVGIIYIKTEETDLYKLGGLWRRFPVTAILMLLAILGITGAPGLNGYASKSLLHHGISMAAGLGAPWLVWIERLFLIVGVGTAASFSKLYYLMFFGKPTKLQINKKGISKLELAMSLLVILMLGIGIRPEFLLDTAIIPTVKSLGIENVSTTLMGLSFWNFKDIFDMIITLIIGILVCWAGLKSGAFHWQPPIWLTIEGVVKLVVNRISIIWEMILKFYNSIMKSIKMLIEHIRSTLSLGFHKFDQSKNTTILGIELIDISADVAILFLVLGTLIIWYTFTNPSIF